MRIACGLMLVGLAACGGSDGDDGTGPGGTPATVAVTASASGALTTLGATRTLTAVVRDASGDELPSATVSWATQDAQIVRLDGTSGRTVTATAVSNGTSRVTATSGSASGTIDLTVNAGGGFPGTASITATAGNAFSPQSVDIAASGTVTWTFAALHNVTFDQVAGAPANITDQSSGTAQRSFAQAGSFPFHCTIHPGMAGSVVVH